MKTLNRSLIGTAVLTLATVASSPAQAAFFATICDDLACSGGNDITVQDNGAGDTIGALGGISFATSAFGYSLLINMPKSWSFRASIATRMCFRFYMALGCGPWALGVALSIPPGPVHAMATAEIAQDARVNAALPGRFASLLDLGPDGRGVALHAYRSSSDN